MLMLKNRRCEMMLMNSLSEANWLSEPHLLSETVSSLSGCKTLKEDKSKSSALSAQPVHPVRMLSLLTHSASTLQEIIFFKSVKLDILQRF
ncbi:hypothetical protein HKD37_13G036597 [Glycine soja]